VGSEMCIRDSCHGERYDPVRLGMRTTPVEQYERLKTRAAELRLARARAEPV